MRAVLEAAAARGIQSPPATEASAVPGKAATARIGERLIAVGSPRYAEEPGATLPDQKAVGRLEADGKAVVAVLADRQLVGVLALRDEPREDAAASIAALREMGASLV